MVLPARLLKYFNIIVHEMMISMELRSLHFSLKKRIFWHRITIQKFLFFLSAIKI